MVLPLSALAIIRLFCSSVFLFVLDYIDVFYVTFVCICLTDLLNFSGCQISESALYFCIQVSGSVLCVKY